MVYKNIHRLTGKLVKLDNRTFAHSKDFLNLLFCAAKLYSHLHVYIHDQTDISLLARNISSLKVRILKGLNIRHIHSHSLPRRHLRHSHLRHSHLVHSHHLRLHSHLIHAHPHLRLHSVHLVHSRLRGRLIRRSDRFKLGGIISAISLANLLGNFAAKTFP